MSAKDCGKKEHNSLVKSKELKTNQKPDQTRANQNKTKPQNKPKGKI